MTQDVKEVQATTPASQQYFYFTKYFMIFIFLALFFIILSVILVVMHGFGSSGDLNFKIGGRRR